MATLTDAEIGDLVTGTLKELGRLKFNQIAQTLQRYDVMNRIMRKDKVQFDDGYGIQRNVMVRHSDAAKHVGLMEKDTVNIADCLEQLDIPWRHTTTHYGYERREMLMNRGKSRIVNLLKVRRIDAMLALAELMETAFWEKPDDSTDKLKPFGVPYWVVKNATEGFYGGDPAGFSNGAGNLATATYAAWKNYTAQYTLVSKSDLISKMRTAYRHIGFESPVDIPDYRRGRGDQYRIYLNETSIKAFEDLGEQQNENLGRDLASMDDTITFRRNPLVWTPQLDSDSTNPIYMLNFAYFMPVFLKGDYLRESDPAKAEGQHNVFVVFVDLTWNVLCTDRRRQAVFYI